MPDVSTLAPAGTNDIVLARLYDAAPELVFAALTDADALAIWWAPDGCTINTHEADIREGGVWHFTLTTPEGKSFNNRHKYLELTPPRHITYWQGEQREDDNAAQTTISIEPAGQATLVTLRVEFSSHDWREKLLPMGAVKYPAQSLAHLADYLRKNVELPDD